MRATVLFVAGLAAGIGFALACSGDGTAGAAPNDCDVWQVARLKDIHLDYVGTPEDLPPGWEPFVSSGGSLAETATIILRRCRP